MNALPERKALRSSGQVAETSSQQIMRQTCAFVFVYPCILSHDQSHALGSPAVMIEGYSMPKDGVPRSLAGAA